MKLMPYPGYEGHVYGSLGVEASKKLSMTEMQKKLLDYSLGEGTTMQDLVIPGAEDGPDLNIRIIKPAGLPEKAPVMIDYHGGGWVSGSNDIDNYRNISLAEGTPCIVVSVEYRLAGPEVHFPIPFNDVVAAYKWVHNHAEEFGGDGDRLAICGTSSGGNLTAGLQLYLRDIAYEAQPKLTVLNCPVIQRGPTNSKAQLGPLGDPDAPLTSDIEYIYLPADGTTPSYYAFPGYCSDLTKLGPTLIIAAEYDLLRDENIEYAQRLYEAEVPCELLVAPRVAHGFCAIDHPLTRWVHAGICASLRREFGMDVVEF